ncbi:hypothetical protein ACSNOH_21130 [Streptomyces sp. URMC 127]|uniref:hypothetical protein n=1 Tax=Streptomyces sp. URMC 127 TaxID=3423402 RepID=UPI003F1B7386
MMKRIAAAAALTGAALTLTATAASAAPMPQPPASNAGHAIAPPETMGMDAHPPTSLYPDGTNQLNKLNQLNQLGQVTQALDPVLGILAPVAGALPM